ncbi:MAG: aminomethyl-transferring glycine dehydrogenase [Neisseriaceae bacterium]|nr:MAG: aminomethyl-transferring glycine dehydrogenase [Neisseriaceae bacterium]
MNLIDIFQKQDFISRHIGSSLDEQKEMLSVLGFTSLDDFINQVIPPSIRFKGELAINEAKTEREALIDIKKIVSKNKIFKSYLGQGYYPTFLPTVILRNLLENPGWYTSYTPYQAEVSQGRLEALLNFQQVCIDLTGMPIAGASLLDEATAAAEAMSMSKRVGKNKTNRFFVDSRIFPQTLDVIQTRARYFNFEIVIGDVSKNIEGNYFGAIIQYTGLEGDIVALEPIISRFKDKGIIVSVIADIMSLVLLKSPGELGADIVLGNSQRFGVPMSFGGPHAAFFAFKDEYKRMAPGRLIGVSVDTDGQLALRMALQTREQHIRREKATSNICTAQALLANIAGMYAVYHGPKRLKQIAKRIHLLASAFADRVTDNKQVELKHQVFFDTLCIDCKEYFSEIVDKAKENYINLGILNENKVLVSFSELSNEEDFEILCEIFTQQKSHLHSNPIKDRLNNSFLRTDDILMHPVFNSYHTEHEMLRYLKKLENKDISLTRSMISLGSCTMKLNATSEMIPITWPKLMEIHPFAPKEQTEGYLELIQDLQEQLKAITGFDGISVQPNSGAQGEYTGLVLIRRYLESIGQGSRNICLIPRSAHGTNPASAQMAGLKVIVVECDEAGNVDLGDLRAKAKHYENELATLMITYPSTHGVFEEGIVEICNIIHEHGGQVYMDGANMNAQVGLMRPADIGADILHINLHKTFCIPHGGGGPGVGPIGFKKHLAPFMPNHVISQVIDAKPNMGAVASAPYGSAGILVITWMYLSMMGREGLPLATKNALLNANYVAKCLKNDFPILYTGQNGFVAHECIVDLRPIKEETGLTEVDFAKRLIDFGFHAPTMSFPVPGTLMIEPTESESKQELDRFIDAMLQIKKEVDKVKNKEWTLDDNPLVHAPHTANSLVTCQWKHIYSREEAVYPLAFVKENKYWPSVSRVNDVYGDKNLICSCPLIEDYLE